MIDRFETARALILNENKQALVLSIFNSHTFVSVAFIRHAEKFLPEVEKLIGCQAIVGLSTVQEWILKGVNLWYHSRIYKFNTETEALDFLVSNSPQEV